MIVRSTLTAAALAASLGAAFTAGLVALPPSASAQGSRTFEAWGHTFDASGTATVSDRARGGALEVVGSTRPRRAYTASGTSEPAASAPVDRTLNVWGARIAASAD